MKRLRHLLTLLILTTAAHSQQPGGSAYNIKAFVPSWKGGTAQLILEGTPVSTTAIQNDMLSVAGNVSSPGPAVIVLRRNRAQLYVPLFLEPGLIRIRTQSAFRLIASGTPLNDAYAAYIQESDSVLRARPAATFAATRTLQLEWAAGYIRRNPGSPVSLRLLHEFYFLDRSTPDTVYHALYEALDSTLKATPTGRTIGQEANARYRTATGRPAPQVLLPDTAGTPRPIITTGHVTLLYFWASWCAPCRRELPSLRKLEADYGASGLVLAGISLDTDKSAWLRAVRTDARSGRQWIEEKGFAGTAATTYGVTVVPTTFLVDAQGVIRGRDLTPEAVGAWMRQHAQPVQ
ncbi:MAG: hypothetical protein JWP27_230 [Flaviaesturariibacter sp.]|nr:hypothetical protein [Flaviaesturariibacter sp.]